MKEISADKHSGSAVKPYFFRIKRIDLHITEPVKQRMPPVIFGLHIGSLKMQVSNDQIKKRYLPGLSIVP